MHALTSRGWSSSIVIAILEQIVIVNWSKFFYLHTFYL